MSDFDSLIRADRVVAVGLLTDSDLGRLGPQFARAYPIDDSPRFAELLRAIDAADARRGRG